MCEEANSRVEQLVQEQQQLRSLVDKLTRQQQGDQLLQQHRRVAGQLQRCLQNNKQLRQQLLQAQAQQQSLQAQLDAATAAHQAVQAQLQPGMQLLQQGMQLLQGAMVCQVAPVYQQQLGQQVLAGQGLLPMQLQQQGSAAGLHSGEQQQPLADAVLQDELADFDIERDIP
jgi:hypothetical protein